MNARIFVGDRRVDGLAADDRGTAYGDGLFETLRVHHGQAPWWDAHWSRLARSAARLRLPLPDEARVRHEADALLDGLEAGVLKLIVTRGSGGRGYAPPDASEPTWILSTHPLPPAVRNDGFVLRWCDTRLSTHPVLAGMKHCNRLEQVLARAEWNDATARDLDADDGLMLDMDDSVVCATAANLFALVDGRWLTPPLDRCGVAGICRAWALSELRAGEARLSRRQIESADAVFLCNAVRGILPVGRLGERAWPLHPQTSAVRDRLAAAAPMFAVNE